MEDLSAKIITRVNELVAGMTFYNRPADANVAVKVIDTFLPAKARDWQEGQDFPFVRVAIYQGEFDVKPSRIRVVITGGISLGDNATVAEGSAEIKRLANALGRIVEKRGFPPYRLVTPVPYQFGDQREGHEGLQPHPYHYVTMKLEFILPGNNR